MDEAYYHFVSSEIDVANLYTVVGTPYPCTLQSGIEGGGSSRGGLGKA